MAARPITDIAIREIAARAGVAHTMIYRHVGSKQDLERAALDRTVNEVLAFT
jgi:AcrR family transcriptional regulator